MDVPVVANVLGTLGARLMQVCWSIQLIPQIVVNYRRHNATGLQSSMMMLWAWAGVPLGVYNIVEGFNIALRIQPQILTLLSLVTWIQCYYYQRGWTVSRSMLTLAPIVVTMGGCQAALIVGLGVLRYRGVDWPMTVMAVLSASLLAAGVLSHYWDIWVHRTVRGISFMFVGIDAAGDLFSLISVFFQPKLDVLGMVIYGTELALWLGVFACGGYYNFLPWARKKWLSQHGSPEESENAEPEDVNTASGSIYLQDLPSSTSVFRTVSAASEGLRSRTMALGGRQ
ncbi:PQ loop repeat protein [Metarhizium guizhouense ARSEF 977]|uniref:PQ loop repeat protein n=1 Tax=Metarhizium guizhouense (strain ARSEF 977) TaxID=1276136 RepID=A0A0B4H882_METGA|nr:PQ loop repeat protein [Metarhizium guizhouense ARSEF 977]